MEFTKNYLHSVEETSPLHNVNTLQLKSFGINQVWKNQQQVEFSTRQQGLFFNIVHHGYVTCRKILPPVIQEINDRVDAEIIVQQDNSYVLNNSHTINYDVDTYNELANIGRIDEDNDIAIIYLKKALVINNGQYLHGLQSPWIPTVRRKLLLDKISLNYQLVYRFKQLGAQDIAQYHSQIAEKHLNSLDIQVFKSHSSISKIKNDHICNTHKYGNDYSQYILNKLRC